MNDSCGDHGAPEQYRQLGRTPLRYVLITPARNEGENIGRTLASMVVQTHRPLVWVVVSDGSTDRTEDIVSEYVQKHDWIKLIRRPVRRERSFAGKVECFNAGLQAVRELRYDVIGNLDADLSFESDYFAFLMARFAEEPRLGVAGTPFVEQGRHYDYRFTNIEHVSGACQLFRRECFADIGGYVPIKGGGIDWVAVTTARMKGWQTRTFTEKSCEHHRPMGTSSVGPLRGAFRQGQKDYYLGGHPIWQIFRSLYQLSKPPYIVGGASVLAGYSWAWMCRQERPVSTQLVRFHRQEQMTRLWRFLRLSAEGATS
jgi:biofilm PGA synthesis N-glycosyltransferase PgaC